MPEQSKPKQEMLEFAEGLPDDATYEEVGEQLNELLRPYYIRQIVDAAEKDIEEGRTTSHEEFKKQRDFE